MSECSNLCTYLFMHALEWREEGLHYTYFLHWFYEWSYKQIFCRFGIFCRFDILTQTVRKFNMWVALNEESWTKLKLEVKLSLGSDFKEIFQSTDNTTKALTENHWKMIHSMCLREIWQVNHLASAHIIRNFGAIALSYPPPPYCYWWLIMKKRGWKLYR